MSYNNYLEYILNNFQIISEYIRKSKYIRISEYQNISEYFYYDSFELFI